MNEAEQEKTPAQGIWCGKMCPELSAPTKEPISASCSKKPQKWPANKPPLFLSLKTDGLQPDALPMWEDNGALRGEYLMHSFGVCPKDENASHLSQILEASPHPKYSLSARACLGILNRAEKRGKQLPEILKLALIQQAQRGGLIAYKVTAYEISSEADFDTLDESIRGEVPPGLFKQITLTFNPWNEHHWIKHRFFDAAPDPDILAMTTNYTCNEWLDAADKKVFETMKRNNPRRYRVAGLGDWGIVEGLVYENWEERLFSIDEVRKTPGIKSSFGLDFGYTNDPTALFCGLIDTSSKTLWVFDEIYKPGMSNEDIAAAVTEAGYAKERIRADSAKPKSIDRLYALGLAHIRRARKGKDSINNGIDFIQDYKIFIHPRCTNFLTEIGNYTWDTDTKTGKKLNRPIDDFNHLMDAMRYALEEYSTGPNYSFK